MTGWFLEQCEIAGQTLVFKQNRQMHLKKMAKKAKFLCSKQGSEFLKAYNFKD